MPIKINCVSFEDGKCMHPAAPKRLFGCPSCIIHGIGKQSDPRVLISCRLLTPRPNPLDMYLNVTKQKLDDNKYAVMLDSPTNKDSINQ